MNKLVIGIAGVKHSGKDTAASMFNYMLSVGITRANYRTWLSRRCVFDEQYKHKIVHFADTLKDCLSLIYNIPRKYFNDTEYKDNLWFNLYNHTFHTRDYLFENSDDFNIIAPYDIINGTLREVISAYPKKTPVIKLRTLMQYFGTDICRDNLGYNIWIDSTIEKIKDVANTYNYCIVPDVRFNNEATAILNLTHPSTGRVVLINRDTDLIDSHSSENIAVMSNFELDNNGSLFSLFYKVQDICQTLISQQV